MAKEVSDIKIKINGAWRSLRSQKVYDKNKTTHVIGEGCGVCAANERYVLKNMQEVEYLDKVCQKNIIF